VREEKRDGDKLGRKPREGDLKDGRGSKMANNEVRGWGLRDRKREESG